MHNCGQVANQQGLSITSHKYWQPLSVPERERERERAMRYICTSIVATLAFAGTAFSATINVPADYPTIQAAVDVAVDGDEIVVAPGTYTGVGFAVADLEGRSIILRSTDGPATTIIDGEDARRCLRINSSETDATQIYGFTMINGNSDDGGGASSMRC